MLQGQHRAHFHTGQDTESGLKVPTEKWEDADSLMFTQY